MILNQKMKQSLARKVLSATHHSQIKPYESFDEFSFEFDDFDEK